MTDSVVTAKKKYVAPTTPPKRIDTHRTDTACMRLVRTKLTPDWVERNVEDRDYGIDMMVEIFNQEEPTGGLILLQIKGTGGSFADPVKLEFPVKTLLYAEMFAAPFFLLHVSLADEKIYYVWLQKYAKIKLPADSPNWKNQEHVNIYFPEENVLNEAGLSRIARLARYTVHRDLGLTFLHHFSWTIRHMDEVLSGNFAAADGVAENLRAMLELKNFLDVYSDFTEDLDIERFIRVLEKAKQYRALDYGDDTFIETQMEQLVSIQTMFLSKDEQDAFLVENTSGTHPY